MLYGRIIGYEIINIIALNWKGNLARWEESGLKFRKNVLSVNIPRITLETETFFYSGWPALGVNYSPQLSKNCGNSLEPYQREV